MRFTDARIIVCRDCTCGWTFPPPGDVDYEGADFHESASGEEHTGFSDLPKAWRAAVVRQVDMIKRHLSPGDQVLEIGCGQGIFLDLLRDQGFKVSGIEPSIAASRKASQRGLPVEQGFYAPSRGSEDIKIVILSQVFEHIGEPQRFLQDLRSGCPNAMVLFIQATYRGLIPRLFKNRWYAWMTHEHFWHFTPKALGRLAGDCGYNATDLEFSTLVHLTPARLFLDGVARLFAPHSRDQFHLLVEPVMRK